MLIVYVYHYEVMGVSYNYLVLHYYISYYSPLCSGLRTDQEST